MRSKVQLLALLSCIVLLNPATVLRLDEGQNLFGQSATDASNIRAKQLLERKISIDLRDATLLEALFAIRDLAGINLVVGNEVTGSVNAAFTDTPVQKILDTLLIPRGYGFRIVSGSVAVMSLENLGNRLPNFDTAVITLRNNKPDDLVDVAQSLLSPEGQVYPIATSSSLMVLDTPDRISEVKKLVQSLELAAQPTGAANSANPTQISLIPNTNADATQIHVRVFQPQYVAASTLADSVQTLLSPDGQISALDSEDKIMVTDNALAIARIAEALQQLDLPRPQVRIWAMIYDCGLEDIKACGVNLNSRVNGMSMNGATGTPAQSLAIDTVTSTLATPANGLMTLTTVNDLGTLTGIVQALETSDDSRLLADPNVVVMNHEQANISIVTQVPYQQLTQGIDGGTIGTTEFRDAGVKLSVTPHIAADQTIALVINPSFSLLTGFTELDNAPIIDQRETSTTVRVENLNTLVLGGLRQRTRLVEKSGIPGLKRIPYLGGLFKFRRATARESELLVFITPEIVTPQYGGTPREACVAGTTRQELEATPSGPVPFGREVLRAEEIMERKLTNRCRNCGKKCSHQNCSECTSEPRLIGEFGAEYE